MIKILNSRDDETPFSSLQREISSSPIDSSQSIQVRPIKIYFRTMLTFSRPVPEVRWKWTSRPKMPLNTNIKPIELPLEGPGLFKHSQITGTKRRISDRTWIGQFLTMNGYIHEGRG